jgi:hypothetical protein
MQADNEVVIQGKVVKGPFVSFVNNDTKKMRVKYQVQIETRKRDNTQSFVPWVRSLGNQAEKDYQNIRNGDIVTVSGRIVTRNECQKRYFRPGTAENGTAVLNEIDIDEDPNADSYDDLLSFDDRRMVTEIQADDVRYFSKTLSMMKEDELKKIMTPQAFAKAIAAANEQVEIENAKVAAAAAKPEDKKDKAAPAASAAEDAE